MKDQCDDSKGIFWEQTKRTTQDANGCNESLAGFLHVYVCLQVDMEDCLGFP